MTISVASGSSARRENGPDDVRAAVEVVRQLVSAVLDTSVRRLHVRTGQLEIEHDPGNGHTGPVAPVQQPGPVPDTEVAQIEAMKLITPVPAGCAGVVEEVCFQDGEVVEFGRPLLRVRPGTDGEDAGDTRRRMARALAEFRCTGVVTNVAVHHQVLTDPGFQAGDYGLGMGEALLTGRGA